MNDEIEFYFKDSGKTCRTVEDYLFVMNNKVYADNSKTFESQCEVIGFKDCIIAYGHIGWRIKPTDNCKGKQ